MHDGWVKTPIGEVAQVLSGFAFKSELFNKSEGIPLIRIRDLPKRSYTEALYSGGYEHRYVVRKGDFLIGMDGEFHCYEWNGPEALLNQRVCRIQDFKLELVDPRFIYFAVNQYLDKIERDTGYTTVKHISSKQILGITIPLPPLPDQKRIVDLISTVDSYIEALQQQLESAKKSRNAVLHELLNRTLEKEMKPLIELAKLQRGHDLPSQDRVEGSIPVVASNGVVGSHNVYKALKPGVVTGRSGTIGKVIYIDEDYWPLNTTLYVIDFKGNIAKYVALVLETLKLENYAGGSTVPSLDRNVLSQVLVPCPNIEEQLRIVQIVESIDEVARKTEQSMAEAKLLRSGLLSDLLSGEHAIPPGYDMLMDIA